jgi:hypothetical protein
VRYDELETMFDAAALFRSLPAYAVPEALTKAIRGVLKTSGWMGAG